MVGNEFSFLAVGFEMYDQKKQTRKIHVSELVNQRISNLNFI